MHFFCIQYFLKKNYDGEEKKISRKLDFFFGDQVLTSVVTVNWSIMFHNKFILFIFYILVYN